MVIGSPTVVSGFKGSVPSTRTPFAKSRPRPEKIAQMDGATSWARHVNSMGCTMGPGFTVDALRLA